MFAYGEKGNANLQRLVEGIGEDLLEYSVHCALVSAACWSCLERRLRNGY